MKLNIITVIFCCLFLGSNCGDSGKNKEDSLAAGERASRVNQQLYDHSSTFIDYNYVFAGESLNHPVQIKENPVTGEIVILDSGNNCLYVFDRNGGFIRRIDNSGEGPGEFESIFSLDIDREGTLYVYDHGLGRLSLFSGDGKFTGSFQVKGGWRTFFSVSDDGEIVFNNMYPASRADFF